MLAPLAAALLAAAPTVYVSMPLHGPARASANAVVKGAQLALTDTGSPIRLRALDDSTKRAGSWVPERVAANARRAASNGSAIGYIGEFNSGASAIALPILNEAGIAMISPSNTYDGLTTHSPGTQPGEPPKYYPTNQRTYFRLTARDSVQAAALTSAMVQATCTRVAVLTDNELYGIGVGAVARRNALARDLRVVFKRKLHRHRQYRKLARSLRKARADCVLYAGITLSGAVPLFRDVGRALPRAKLFGPDGIAESRFTGRIPRSVARRTLITVSTLATEAYPAEGQRVINRYHDPYAAYGYEAMRLFVDAYNGAGAKRPAIVDFLHGVQNRAGVIGTYGFDANGDTTSRTFGLYGIRGGELTWVGPVSG
jgi:branched-chain amino acid transport system substrate-binding protein